MIIGDDQGVCNCAIRLRGSLPQEKERGKNERSALILSLFIPFYGLPSRLQLCQHNVQLFLHRLASLLPMLNDNSTRAIFLKGEVFKILRQKITENIYVKIISARLLLIDPFWISKRAYEVKGHAWLNFSSSLCVPASVKRRVTEVKPYSRFTDQKQAALFCILWRHGNFSNCTGNRGKLD